MMRRRFGRRGFLATLSAVFWLPVLQAPQKPTHPPGPPPRQTPTVTATTMPTFVVTMTSPTLVATATTTPAAPRWAVLMQTGGYLLTQSGGRILLEA